MRRVVEAKTLANGVGEDGTEQPDTATGDTTPTTNDRQTAWLGLLPGGCLARGDVVHEAIDIITRDRGHRLPAEQGDDVADNPAPVGNQHFSQLRSLQSTTYSGRGAKTISRE